MKDFFYKLNERLSAIGGKKNLTESAAGAYPGDVPEHLDELSKDTLGSYIKKASQDAQDAAYASSSDHGRGYDSRGDRHYDHAEKRQRGIGKAVDKLMKENSNDEYVHFDIDGENALEVFMDRFDHIVDWDDDDHLVIPRKEWGNVQRVIADANGEAIQVDGHNDLHPSTKEVENSIKSGYGDGVYKNIKTGGQHVVKQDGNVYRSGMMRASTLSNLLKLIDKTVKESDLMELSPKTLGNYVDKANRSRDNAHEIGNFIRQNPGRDANADHKDLEHFDNRKIKRTRGIEKATGKLAKECGMNEHGSGVESMKGTWQSHMHEEVDIEGLISDLRKAYANINTIDPSSPTYKKLIDFLDGLDQEHLQILADAGVKFVSMLAKNRLKRSEKLDEISKDTATKYIKKASAGATDFEDVPEKRKKGVHTALKKKHGGAKVPATEGYRVIPKLDDEYEERQGLEGPFNANGRPIYYDPREGKYWDPKTDFYLDDEEAAMLFNESYSMNRNDMTEAKEPVDLMGAIGKDNSKRIAALQAKIKDMQNKEAMAGERRKGRIASSAESKYRAKISELDNWLHLLKVADKFNELDPDAQYRFKLAATRMMNDFRKRNYLEPLPDVEAPEGYGIKMISNSGGMRNKKVSYYPSVEAAIDGHNEIPNPYLQSELYDGDRLIGTLTGTDATLDEINESYEVVVEHKGKLKKIIVDLPKKKNK